MKLEGISYFPEFFGYDSRIDYWEKCFSVCPICGGRLKYRIYGKFDLEIDDIIPTKIGHSPGGFPTTFYNNINIHSKDAKLTNFKVWCTTNWGNYKQCPFSIDFTRQKTYGYSLIGGGLKVDDLNVSRYIDNLVDIYNQRVSWGKIPKEDDLLDKSKLYWRLNDIPLDGIKDSVNSDEYFPQAYSFRDLLRVMKQYQKNHDYGTEEKVKIVEELEMEMDAIIEKLKDYYNSKGEFNRNRIEKASK